MTARRDITELELLALVEGDASLPRERREALLADPTVQRLVARLVADREHLTALPRTQPAPANLVASAIERAEREALAALAAAEPATGAQIRSSTTFVERPGVLARLVSTRWPSRLAAAAGLALAAAGVYFAAVALIDWNASQPSRLVINPPKPGPTTTVPSNPDAPTPAPIEVAVTPDAPAVPAPALTVPNGPIDTATAVSLVPQGRVMLVLRASDPQAALATIGATAQRHAGAQFWQPLAADSPEYAAALAAVKAGGFDFAGSLKPPSIALIGVGASTHAFEALVAALRTDAAGTGLPQWAAVDASALKIAHDRASTLALQPHRVLWWEQGSAAWTPPAVVPVVILPE